MKRRRGWLFALAFVAVLGGGAWWAVRTTAVAGAAAGRPIPDLTLPDLAGRPVSLSAWRGGPLVLWFSSVACSICTNDWGQLAARQKAADGRFRIVAVEVGQSAETVRSSLAGLHVPFPVLIDAGARLASALGLRGLPSYAFFDARGRLVSLVWASNRDTDLSAANWTYYVGRMLRGSAG